MSCAYDPYSPEVRNDPAPAHAELRLRCPVHYYAPKSFFSVSRHADVSDIARAPELWSSRLGPGPDRDISPRPMLLTADPPMHTTQRRLIQKAFTPRMVAALEPNIEAATKELIDGFVGAGRADLIEAFAYPLPLIVIAEMLGVPPEDRERFKRWSDDFVADIGSEEGSRAPSQASFPEFAGYFGAAIGARQTLLDEGRETPEDLLTGLVGAEYEGRKLAHDEMLGLIAQLLVAGNETTTSLIGNVVYRLLERPEELAKLMRDPALVETAVEESLRYDAPIQGLFRTNNEALTLHGVELPVDSKVMVLFASANRDAEAWEDPDVFRVDRDPMTLRRHYAFGHGIHYCIGAPLARLEGRVALRALLQRLPNLRLAGPPALVRPFFQRGFAKLPVAWDLNR